MATLTFREVTVEFKQRTSMPLDKINFPNGTKSGERVLNTYDVYKNDTQLPVYTLTVLNEGNDSAEYRLYAQFKGGDMKLYHGFFDKQNFPFNAMVNLYSVLTNYEHRW